MELHIWLYGINKSYKMFKSFAKIILRICICYYGSGFVVEYLFKKGYEKKYLKSDHNSVVANMLANIILHIFLTMSSFVVLFLIPMDYSKS